MKKSAYNASWAMYTPNSVALDRQESKDPPFAKPAKDGAPLVVVTIQRCAKKGPGWFRPAEL